MRLQHLDGLRALAATYVVLGHAWLTVFDEGGDRGVATVLVPWLAYGHFAVTVFMVLSGYSLMLGPLTRGLHLSGGTRGFLARRARRILPAYWFTLALSVLLGVTLLADPPDKLWALSVPFSTLDVLVHAALFQDVYNGSAINYVLWSMSLEWHTYFLMPLLLLAFRRWGGVPVVVVTVIATSAIVRLAKAHTDIVLAEQLHLVGAFAVGMLACQIGRKETYAQTWRVAAWLFAATVVAAVYASHRLPSLFYEQSIDVIVMAAAACFLIAAPGSSNAVEVRMLAARPVAFVGRSSYSLYLMHPLVLAGLWAGGIHQLDASPMLALVLLIAVAYPISVGVAALSYRYVESPFMRRSSASAEQAGKLATVPA